MDGPLAADLLQVREAHVVAKGVHNERGHQVTGPQKQVCRVHAEYGRVGELAARGNYGRLQGHSHAQVFDHVVEVRDPEE